MLSLINFEIRNLKLFEYVRNSQSGSLFTLKSKFATRIRRMLCLVSRKLRKIHGFLTYNVDNSFRMLLPNPAYKKNALDVALPQIAE